jgi:hypothetical protein
MNENQNLIELLTNCPRGAAGWQQYEDICTRILTLLFVPPLMPPRTQPRTYSGTDRRDSVFANRNINGQGNWGHLFNELEARMVLFEFKNYDTEEVGKEETNQTRNYLTAPMGKLAIICSRRLPDHGAHVKRNTIFSAEGKVILFLTDTELIEMLRRRERGEEPSDLLLDMVESFYLQHE